MRHDAVKIKSMGQGCRKQGNLPEGDGKRKALMAASVASMIDQFNLPNIRILLKMGLEVHVLCNFREGNTCDRARVRELLETLRAMHVICHQWDCPRNIYSLKKCARAYQQLLGLMDRHQFAWMHCQSPVGGALARLAGRRKNIRMVYTAHGFHFYKGAPWKNWLLYYPAEKLLARWTDVVITVNREDYRIARQELKAGKILYIPGIGIDIPKFCGQGEGMAAAGNLGRRAFCQKYRIPEDATILLSVGELSRRKNHQAVVAALAKLREANVYYLVCGQGELKSRLEAQARALGVSRRIRLAGFQKDMGQMYQNADIFVFPSLQEGLPAALMEAMAAGLPCVVSDIRGNRELVDDEGGIKFRPGPPGMLAKLSAGRRRRTQHGLGELEGLEEALETMLGNEGSWQDYGRHNQQKIKKYGLETVNRRMEKIYAAFDRECRMQSQESGWL